MGSSPETNKKKSQVLETNKTDVIINLLHKMQEVVSYCMQKANFVKVTAKGYLQ